MKTVSSLQLALPSIDDSAYQAARRSRWDTLSWLQEHGVTTLKGVSTCRRFVVPGGAHLKLGYDLQGRSRASLSRLITCKSAWSCPVCSAVSSHVRSLDVSSYLRTWTSAGHSASFVTLTIQHKAGESAQAVQKRLAKAFRAFQSGRGYEAYRDAFDVASILRVTEATHSHSNGWHFHLHCVFFHDGSVDRKTFIEATWKRWENSVKLAGGYASRDAFDVGRTYSDSGLAKYLTKLGNEMSMGSLKTGKTTSRTPFSILADLRAKYPSNHPTCTCVRRTGVDGVVTFVRSCDLCLWTEWEAASKGKRMIGFSHKSVLFDLLADVEADVTEAEIEALHLDNVLIAVLPQGTVSQLRRDHSLPTLIDIAETHGADAVYTYLRDYRYEYTNRVTGEIIDSVGLEFVIPE